VRNSQPAFPVLADAGRVDVRVQGLGEGMMTWHRVVFAAFLVQPNRPADTARPQILDLYLQRRVMRAKE